MSLPPSFTCILRIVYKFLHKASTFYTTSKLINYVSYKFHTLLHLVLMLAVHRVVHTFRALYITFFHNQCCFVLHTTIT